MRGRWRSLLLGPLALTGWAACGDIYADPVGVAVASKVAADAGSFEDEAIVVCPPNRPRENSICQAVGSACEYGGSADRECNGVLVCRGAESQSYWDRQGNGRCSRNTCPTAGTPARRGST
jgi:hypothetical protein